MPPEKEEREIAGSIEEIVGTLNKAIGSANAMGIEVTIEAIDVTPFNSGIRQILLNVKITKLLQGS